MLGILAMRILGYTNLVVSNREYKVIRKTQKRVMERGQKMLCTFCFFAFWQISQFFSADLSLEKQKRLT